jgi:hypothetical protein
VNDEAKRLEYKKRIFRLAVQKARDNGLTHCVGDIDRDFAQFLTLFADEPIDGFFEGRPFWAGILFDNSFCRLIWGTASVIPIGQLWVYHRREMLSSDDPFAYIARYL